MTEGPTQVVGGVVSRCAAWLREALDGARTATVEAYADKVPPAVMEAFADCAATAAALAAAAVAERDEIVASAVGRLRVRRRVGGARRGAR